MTEADRFDSKAQIAAAEEMRQAGRFAEAAIMFQDLLMLKPGNVQASLGAGRCALQLGDHAVGLKLLTAAAVNGKYPFPALELAAECIKAGRLDDAESAYRTAMEIAPNKLEAAAGLAACARLRGDRAAATEWQGRACAIAPDDVNARMELGRDLQESQRFEEARAAYEAVLIRKPGLMKALRALVAVARSMEDPERALALLDQAAAADPEAGWTRTERAAIQRDGALAAGREALAAGDLERALPLFTGAAELLKTAAPLLELAASCLRGGHLDAAEAAFRSAMAMVPGKPEPLTGLAHVARERGDRAGAVEWARKACAIAPDDVNARMELGRDLQELGRLDEARTVYDEVLTLKPGLPRALRAAVVVARGMGDSGRALALLAAAAAADPQAAWPRTERTALQRDQALASGRRALAEGDPARALPLFTDAAELDKSAAPLLEMGSACLAAGQLDAAEAAFKRATAIGPGKPDPLHGLAQVARARGDEDAAIEWERRAAGTGPDDIAARLEHGRALQQMRRFPEALAVFDEVLARKPGLVKALKAAIGVARAMDDTDRVVALLEQAARAEPDAAWPRVELAAIHRERGDSALASAAARQELERDGGSSAGWLQIGLLERSNGHSEAALAAFEQAHALDPANVNILLQMARENRALGFQKRCDELLADAAALDPHGIQVVSQSAEQALMGNDPAGALALYENGLEQHPAQLSFYIGACNALTRLGRVNAAMAMLDRAAAQCGSPPALHARRAQLLRDAGRLREALVAAQDGLKAHPRSFLLWEAVMRLQIMVGPDADLHDWLAEAPVAREAERAVVAGLTGDVAMAQGDVAGAIAQYERAARMQPTNSSHQANLAKASLIGFDLARSADHLREQCDLQAPMARLRNRSTNASQTYIGQVINEYQLDAGALEQVSALAGAAPEARITALLDLVRKYPDNTLIAVALVDGLWRSGALQQPGVQGAASAIPRRIVQFWEAEEQPEEVRELMGSWDSLNPGFTHEVFDDRRARAFLAANFGQDVLFGYHRAAAASLKSDIFRLACIAHGGGIYVDPDNRSTAPLTELLPGGAELVLYREELGTLGSDLIAATPGHPVIRLALEQAAASINRGDRDSLRLSTGPGLVTRCFAQVLAAGSGTLEDRLRGVRVWSRRTVQRTMSIHCFSAYAATGPYRSRAAFTNRTYMLGDGALSVDDTPPATNLMWDEELG